ncbi:unnamed protein product [Moneuplotes crassus]|uniref:Uncharacterized protein n=1 Tax=Euplotes crassus TaxID=5936 RepID=A0AAD2CY15_EUPCR|nr:unnamed protein product [Moneuplotes crassus]
MACTSGQSSRRCILSLAMILIPKEERPCSDDLISDFSINDQSGGSEEQVEDTAEESLEEEKTGSSITPLQNINFSICDYIQETYSSLHQRQSEIDSGTFIPTMPGRRRLKPYKTTSQLKDLISSHLQTEIRAICSIPCRLDSVPIKLYRLLRSLPLFLVKTCSSKSMYKKGQVHSFLFSFLESYVPQVSDGASGEYGLVKSFMEYCMLCFPYGKCMLLIRGLRKEGFDEEYCRKLERMLKNRESTSKKKILKYVAFSEPIRAIFRQARDILTQSDFPQTEISQKLIGFVDYILQRNS